MDPRWKHPFTSIIAGPTGCGKTQFVITFLNNLSEMTDPTPEKIIYSYGEWQQEFRNLPSNVELTEGIPDLCEYSNTSLLLIIDDQMHDVNDRILSLFTKGSHHRNISVMYIVQNLFDQNAKHRTISLNAHYLVVFKNPRDASQIVHLAKQMYPGQTKYAQEAFALATRYPHGYLLVDLKQQTPEHLRLRGHIFPGENKEVYVAKKI